MAVSYTNFTIPKQSGFYKGKVRDVYYLTDKMLVVATDRISAFDVILPKPIPYKGQILNQIAAYFLEATKEIAPNWLLATPDPNVSYGVMCTPYAVEMVIRGYLAGHAWREYKAGKRILCGVSLPNGLKENDKLPHPIITPSTKAKEGHDEDISRDEIIAKNIVSQEEYKQLENYTYALFEKGTEMAANRGLILVDTKYEFGEIDGKIMLIDEIHTPDSSRYFYADTYAYNQENNLPQKQLSKEFVREWLIANGFQGKDGQQIPEMTTDIINSITERYIELYEKIKGKNFIKAENKDIENRIYNNILNFLQ